MGHLESTQILLDHPSTDSNLKGVDLQTPLHLAAERGHLEITKALANHLPSTDVNLGDSFGQAPFGSAVKERKLSTAQYLQPLTSTAAIYR